MNKDDFLTYRKQFPILNNTTYLISNSLGAMPVSVYDRMKDYADDWANWGVKAWEEKWWMMNMEIGNRVASLIGTGENEISMHPNISTIQSIIISAFDFSGKKNKIVYTDLEFPSDMYVFEKFATSQGANIEVIKSDNIVTPPIEKLLDAIDEETLLVPVSHVLFKSAYIMDIKSIVEKAHSVGAYVILDSYHAIGVLDIDVKELDVDFCVGGLLKWCCGGPGGCFLWLKPELRKKLEPVITGWLAHKEPFAFEERMEYTDSAYKFLNGTPPIPAYYAVQEGPKIIKEIGLKNIRERSLQLTKLIIEEAQNRGYKVNTPLLNEKRAGTVTIDMQNSYEVSRELLKRNILIDYRPGAGIRVAPHFYNTEDEILYLYEEIKNIQFRM